MSVSYLKGNSDNCDRVHRVAILPGGTEADLRGGIQGVLLQSVAETPYHAQDTEISGPGEEDLEHDVAFDVCAARFVCVGGTRLEEDFERLGGGLTMGGGLSRIRGDRGRECRSGGCRFSGRLCRSVAPVGELLRGAPAGTVPNAPPAI
jgi:hypothetical protein